MEIGDWKAAAELSRVYRDARELGLESNLAELEAFGFTVVRPEKAASPGFAARLLEAVRSLAAREDPSAVKTFARQDRPAAGRQLYHLFNEDPLFVEALMNPVVLTLGRYLMGASARVSNTVALVKEGPAAPTIVHCDSVGVPPPLPAYGSVCNASYILTDYSKANGTFYMVPGSHRWCRHPTPLDQPSFLGGPADDELGIPIEAEAGSLLVFHGNTWHGTYPKTEPGERVHLIYMFARTYMATAEDWRDVPEALVEAHGAEFAHLIGRDAWQGYGHEGPTLDHVRAVDRVKFTPSA